MIKEVNELTDRLLKHGYSFAFVLVSPDDEDTEYRLATPIVEDIEDEQFNRLNLKQGIDHIAEIAKEALEEIELQ